MVNASGRVVWPGGANPRADSGPLSQDVSTRRLLGQGRMQNVAGRPLRLTIISPSAMVARLTWGLFSMVPIVRFDLVGRESGDHTAVSYGADLISENTSGKLKVAKFETDNLNGKSFTKTGVSGDFASLISLARSDERVRLRRSGGLIASKVEKSGCGRPISRPQGRHSGGLPDFGRTPPHASSVRLTRNRFPSANSVKSWARFLASPR